jgi:iron uptake system EfeUOB component EfeO/EfeM
MYLPHPLDPPLPDKIGKRGNCFRRGASPLSCTPIVIVLGTSSLLENLIIFKFSGEEEEI